jgi:phosphohistidine phosphatase SixA
LPRLRAAETLVNLATGFFEEVESFKELSPPETSGSWLKSIEMRLLLVN